MIISRGQWFNALSKLSSIVPISVYNSNLREKAVIARLFSYPAPFHFAFAAGHPWKWRAVNVPYKLVEQGEDKGDIDLLYCIERNPSEDDIKFLYRAFEAKVTVLDGEGKMKSAKLGRGHMHKAQSQLKRLLKDGASQVFLLDIFSFETGFSDKHGHPSLEVIEAIEKKRELLTHEKIGHVALFLETPLGADEDHASVAHPIINVLPADIQEPSGRFLKLMDKINEFYEKEIEEPSAVITYCESCKSLTWFLEGESPHIMICKNCFEFIFDDLLT